MSLLPSAWCIEKRDSATDPRVKRDYQQLYSMWYDKERRQGLHPCNQ